MADKPSRPMVIATTVSAGSDLPEPVGANFFHITRVDTEFEVLIGNVSLLRVHDTAAGGVATPLEPQITHRLLLSQFGFDKLARVVSEMSSKLEAQGKGASA